LIDFNKKIKNCNTNLYLHIFISGRGGRPHKINRGIPSRNPGRFSGSTRSTISPSDSNITPSRPTSAMSVSSQGSSGSSHGGSRSGSGRPRNIKRPGGPGRGHKSN
jgi:hypothetical protein